MKTSRVLTFLVLGAMSFPLLAHAQATTEPDSPAAPALGPLQGKWEDVDQRFVFLTVDLASTEASISAVNKVLAMAGNEQAKEQQRAEGYHNGNVQMDRNGGGPVGWQDFYGQTAQNFYFHTSTTIHGRSRYSSVTVRQTNTPTPIGRPPQFDYIYRANADAQAHAEADVAKMGNKLDELIRRRKELEEEQSALWCKIALRALTTRELGDKPIYRFEPSTTDKDDTHQQAVLAVAAGAKFMRTINTLVADSQKALDGDQRPVYAKLAETIAHARAELKTVLLAQPMLQISLADEDSPLGQFAMAAKRLEDSSQNLTDAYGLALEGDKSGDFQRKLNFRGQMQMMTMDFAATVMTANDALSDTADFWKITPDVKKPVASDTAVLIVATTRPSPEVPAAKASLGDWHRILNKANRLYLSVTSANKNRGNGASVAKAGNGDNEQWALASIPGYDGIKLVSKYSNLCLGVRQESDKPGMDVIEWTGWNTDMVYDKPHGNNWRLEAVGDSFKIVNELSGQCLTYQNGKTLKVVQEPFTNSDDQLWYIEPVK